MNLRNDLLMIAVLIPILLRQGQPTPPFFLFATDIVKMYITYLTTTIPMNSTTPYMYKTIQRFGPYGVPKNCTYIDTYIQTLVKQYS